jgi:hypothetical protein
MAEITVTVRARVRGLLIARLFGHVPGAIGRWARCRIRVDAQIGRGPWKEIGRWEEPTRA